METIYFRSPDEMRAWLEANHASASELTVGFYKKGASQQGITYEQALDEALCYGWIDGVRRRVDDERYTNRFSPRRKGSLWSTVNIAKVEALIAQGRMRPAGLAAYAQRDEAKTEENEAARTLDEDFQARFAQENPAGWDFFQAQSPSYRRIVSRWIMSAKREETRLKRLSELMELSGRGERKVFM